MRNFEELLLEAKKCGRKDLILAGADDVEALKAVEVAAELGLVRPVLVGNKELILNKLENFSLKDYELSEADSAEEIAEKSVMRSKPVINKILMKGSIKTAYLLKAVLNKEWGLRTGNLLSHVVAADIEGYDRLLFITDGGMVIKPSIEEKVQIIENAVSLAFSIGIETPKVACVTAVEVINPSIPETLDCAILSKMNQRGQIKGCKVEGPLGLDYALSEFAAKIKKVEGDVAGKADILLVPDINSGNFLGKSVEYFAGGKIAGLIMGAMVPIIIVSRADKSESKLASILLAIVNSKGGKEYA